MAIRETNQIPRELPPAKLYLGDVEGIVKVFIASADLSSVSEGAQPRVSFAVKTFECDTVEELQQLGRTKSNVLGIYVDIDKEEVGSLEIVKGRPASWGYGPGMRKDDRFKVYGQLQALFHIRRIRWKSAVLRCVNSSV